jgi:rubredoxin
MNRALQMVLGELPVTDGLTCTEDLRFFFDRHLIAECETVGDTLIMDIHCHELDVPILQEEFEFCRVSKDREAGWMQIVLMISPGREELSAVKEAFMSAIDRVAPGFDAPDDSPFMKGAVVMDRYTCVVCGWVYDPELGDPDGGIPAGVAFSDLPDDWVCPVCGAPKTEFEKE